MNGAEIILKTARDAGVEICFANAGTTELSLVVAFDTVSGIRPVLGLFEGVCTGAADGFGRIDFGARGVVGRRSPDRPGAAHRESPRLDRTTPTAPPGRWARPRPGRSSRLGKCDRSH